MKESKAQIDFKPPSAAVIEKNTDFVVLNSLFLFKQRQTPSIFTHILGFLAYFPVFGRNNPSAFQHRAG